MKHILFGLAIITTLSACSDAGKKAATSDAQQVEDKTTATSITFGTVKEGSQVDWRAAHLGGLEPRFGKAYLQSATVTITDGKVVNAKATIDMSSFTVDNFEDKESEQKLAGHLMSPDFFDVSNNPTATFELSSIMPSKGKYNSTVTGNLTIKGVSKSISFNANVAVSDNQVSISSEDFAVDRRDWDLSYNVEGTAGVPANYIIANDIGFTIAIVVSL